MANTIVNYSYVLAPILACVVAMATKLIIDIVKNKRFAFNLGGYGGLPSSHSSIVASTTTLIALKQGLYSPAFGVAFTVSLIVIFDANSLRKQIGKQAEAINHLSLLSKNQGVLRERIGHNCLEIVAGIIIGIGVAVGLQMFLS